MHTHAGRTLGWVFIVSQTLVVGVLCYLWPAVQSMENELTALRAETAWGRLDLAWPCLVSTFLLAPIPAAITYQCGTRLPKVEARASALAVGLILIVCSLAGSVLFVVGKEAYMFPFWVGFHLGGHPVFPMIAPGCPLC